MDPAHYPLNISSPEFGHMGYIPVKYTCDGENINPPLQVQNIPVAGQSMVLIVEDEGVDGNPFTHWLVWNIMPGEVIQENTESGVTGINSAGHRRYMGPCPPAEGVHRYFFTLHVLDTNLDLDELATRSALENAIEKHILSSATLVGLYRRAL
jgi:Raf kinase inhibitor-like YbhB/YbcL family protein